MAREPLRRASPRQPCPVCGARKWCGFDDQRVVCMRVPSDRPARNGGWVHHLAQPPAALPRAPRLLGQRRAPAWVLDRAYRALLRVLVLRPEHRAELRRRGLDDGAIARHGYRSMPEPEAARKVAEAVLRRSGLRHLCGVPGFGVDHEGALTMQVRAGFLVPVRDLGGLLRGFQVRLDNPEEGGPKYPWFSTPHLRRGASSGAPVHVARPGRLSSRVVWVTEGPLKAAIAAERLGAVILGVPGVDCWRAEVVALVRQMDPPLVATAFDADWRTNEAVARQLEAMSAALRDAGFEVAPAEWPPEAGKGLDDVLTGPLPDTVTLRVRLAAVSGITTWR